MDRLVEPTERGDPNHLCAGPARVSAIFNVSFRLKATELGGRRFRKSSARWATRCRAIAKTREGTDHPDRNAQFEYIARRVKACRRGGRPAISVDTKKKETLGNKANVGKEYRPSGEPLEVDTHDFPDKQLGKAMPYGVYDIKLNEAWVSVGISRDTAEFAVHAIRLWWRQLGRKRYDKPKRLLITADSGGSNENRNRLWKYELQRLADKTGMVIEVCHYPPGTSKMEQDRASLVLSYYTQLARRSARDSAGRC